MNEQPPSASPPSEQRPPVISWDDFQRVELRLGTIIHAEPNPTAKKPAYRLQVDLGPLGIKTSSAQITALYSAADLLGRQVLCVCNFPPKRVAGVTSEVLVTGFHDHDGRVVLCSVDHPVPNGTPLL
ncbi:tRNA-binding protein [Permianibacter sp. IMCC34836]|uniref:tRNA-binding protein n=1 Tax=Permianibacter fluminis TaxID=2738515 RepID=UPI00155576FF|nr:tRNA-binding protein [Permianibacter fluminis]NQD38106.1 tRNA-binding protein [Permianibacter fluminis]